MIPPTRFDEAGTAVGTICHYRAVMGARERVADWPIGRVAVRGKRDRLVVAYCKKAAFDLGSFEQTPILLLDFQS